MTTLDLGTTPLPELVDFDFRAPGRDVVADVRTVQARVDAFLDGIADADLGELVTGAHPGRTSSDQRTMACNLGVAIDDVAVGIAILRAAERSDIGIMLPL